MVSTNANALGIIFPNCYDDLLPEMTCERTMASVPFGSRYRMIDFVLSSMSNCGISNISVLVKKNYHSLMDHLGAGREWDLSRKHGGLNIVPPFYEENVKVYGGRVEALASIVNFLSIQKEKYVIMSDANLAVNVDFSSFIERHVESGADVTMYYQSIPIPESIHNHNHTLKVENGRVVELLTNDNRPGIQNLSMNIYIMERETLIQMNRDANIRNLTSFERDILSRNLALLNVQGIQYTGYVARICDMKSYYDENMKLLKPENLAALFGGKNTIYTKIRDDAPTRYAMDCRIKNSMVADGCIIEGDVENSILFRGVRVKKGAKVRNCVLMQDTVVEEGADVEYVVTDKRVKITADKQLNGTDTFPVYVAKAHTV